MWKSAIATSEPRGRRTMAIRYLEAETEVVSLAPRLEAVLCWAHVPSSSLSSSRSLPRCSIFQTLLSFPIFQSPQFFSRHSFSHPLQPPTLFLASPVIPPKLSLSSLLLPRKTPPRVAISLASSLFAHQISPFHPLSP